MSFSIQLSSDLISVEAGDNTPVNLQVANRSEQGERFEIEVEGLDPEWTAIPVPLFTVAAGDTQTEKIFLRPGRAPESLAGNYPFVVKVRSLNSGDTRTAQGVLQIKPYNHLSMEVQPKKGSVSPARSAEIFHASFMNLGNTEQTLQIFGSDPEDAFAFEFANAQVTVGPGQQKDVEVRATPTNRRPFSAPRLHVFTISARSIQTPSLVASSQAQIEQRPLVTPGTLGVGIFLFLIGLIWFMSRPQPPALDVLNIEPPQPVYTAGQQVTVKWHASHAQSVFLKINEQEMTVGADGFYNFVATTTGDVTAYAVGANDRMQSKPISRHFEVRQPERAPLPRIDAWSIDPHDVNVGQSFLVKFTVSDSTTKLTLAPKNQILDPKIGQIELKADEKGTFKYFLVAENANGVSVKSKPITIKVIEASQAHVIFFDVQPREVDVTDSKVTVNWQTSSAARVVLAVNGATMDLTPQDRGEQVMQLQRSSEFQIVVYDPKGVMIRSPKISVRVKVPPTPPPTDSTGTAGTTGITASPGTTTGTNGNNNPQPITSGGGG